MLRDTTVYFVGKILNEKEDDDDNAETFRFSKTERASLAKQLRNIPVQLEHEDTLKVGQITNAFRDNNDQFWVFGKVNAKDFKGTFAKHSLQKKGTAGAYYTGLSMQHVHREYKDGRKEKQPIEVSLCTDPRRRNCKIVWTSNESNKKPYIGTVHAASSISKETNLNTMSEQAQNTPAPQAAPVAAAPAATPAATEAAPATEPAGPSGIELNQQVYEQMAELYEKEQKQQQELAALKEQLQKHQTEANQAKEVQLQDQAKKSKALLSSMLEHFNELIGQESTQELEPQLMPLMQSNPLEMNNFLEVVAKASKQYKNQSMELQTTKNSLAEKEMELKFQTLIKQHGLPAQTVEVASSRKRTAAPAAPAAPTHVQAAAKSVKQNPYLGVRQAAQPGRRRQRSAMNKDLLGAFMKTRGSGARQNMASLHNSLKETMQQRGQFGRMY